MKEMRRRHMYTLAAGVCLASLNPAAFAQEGAPADQPAGNLNRTEAASSDIVVTAARRAQSLQDVPMSINVATGEQIEKLKIFDAKDVQQLAPSLELSNNDGRSNKASLRGISFDPDSGTSPAIDLYFNEIPIDAQTAFTAIYDIDQIEVLRGPQGALRGRTSPAGAITLRTRRANLSTVEGYAQATATEDHAYNLQAGVSVPVITDKLAVRVSGLLDGNRLNQVKNITRDEYSRSRTESARLSVGWQPLDDLTVNLMYQYLHANNLQQPQIVGPGNAAIGNDPHSLDERVAVTEGTNRFINTSHLLTANVNWNLGGVTLDFNGGRQRSKLRQSTEGDVGNAVHNYAPESSEPAVIPYNVDTAEARLLSNNDGFWNWTIGAFYSKQTGDYHSRPNIDTVVGIPGVPTPVAIIPLEGELKIPIFSRTMSVSASSRFKFSDKLTFEVAARYSSILARQKGELTIPGFGVLTITDRETKSHPLTGAATLTYEANRDLTVYAAYGRSFRARTGAVTSPQNGTGADPKLLLTDPERSDSFEVGLKAAFLDRRLSLDVSAFYQKFDGFISRILDIAVDQGTQVAPGFFAGPPDGAVDKIEQGFNYNGNAKIKGIEATLSGRPTDNWDISVSASYIRARYSNALLPCNTVDAQGNLIVIPNAAFGGVNNISYCQRNDRLSPTPDFNLTANSEIRFSTGSVQPFIRGLVTYRPSVFFAPVDFKYPSRTLLNVFAGVRGDEGKWEVSVFARNLLNQARVTNINLMNAQVIGRNALNPAGQSVVFDSGYRRVVTTNPREFGVSASFRF